MAKATSTSHRNKFHKHEAELHIFDEKLKHDADMWITLDLYVGVKVNYGKFNDSSYGDILADVRAICCTKDED